MSIGRNIASEKENNVIEGKRDKLYRRTKKKSRETKMQRDVIRYNQSGINELQLQIIILFSGGLAGLVNGVDITKLNN